MLPLWNKVQERKRKLSTNVDGAESFKVQYTTIGMLIKAESEWIINFLCSISDCTPQHFIKIKKHDPDGLCNCVSMATQLEMRQKLSSDHQVKDIMWGVLQKLNTKYGERLASMANEVSLLGAINYLELSPHSVKTSDEQIVTDLDYGGTEANATLKAAGFTNLFHIKNLWLDMCAEFVKPGISGTKLSSFFNKGSGQTPNALTERVDIPDPKR